MQRVRELDAIRGIAAVAIVVFHLQPGRLVPLGTAVDLFFVLSGYLITGIILKHLDDRHFFAAFYARRALRIWPIYYLSLFLVVGVNWLSPLHYPLSGFPYFLTYTQNIQGYWYGTPPAFIPAFQHTWTLAIEEQFYLIWPFLLCAVRQRGVIPLTVALLAMSSLARVGDFYRWILLTQCDGLAFGSLLAALFADRTRHQANLKRFDLAFAGVCFLSAGFVATATALFGRLGVVWQPVAASLKVLATNAFYFGAVGLVIGHAGAPQLSALRGRALAYLGKISYGMYVYHYIVLIVSHDLLEHYGYAKRLWLDVGLMVASVGLAALSWHFIEEPLLRLKDRFQYGERPRVSEPKPAASSSGEPPIRQLAPAMGR